MTLYHPAKPYSNDYPQFPPNNYKILQHWGLGFALINNIGLRVIIDIQERNNESWLHVSFSRNHKLPSYQEIKQVKTDFIGKDNVAIMIFPAQVDYVNLHEFCLHLWHCITNKEIIPNFVNQIGDLKII